MLNGRYKNDVIQNMWSNKKSIWLKVIQCHLFVEESRHSILNHQNYQGKTQLRPEEGTRPENCLKNVLYSAKIKSLIKKSTLTVQEQFVLKSTFMVQFQTEKSFNFPTIFFHNFRLLYRKSPSTIPMLPENIALRVAHTLPRYLIYAIVLSCILKFKKFGSRDFISRK